MTRLKGVVDADASDKEAETTDSLGSGHRP